EYREVYKRENIAFRSDLLVPLWQDRKVNQLVITSSGQLNHFVSQLSELELDWLFKLTLYVPSERIEQEALQLGFKKVVNTYSASNKDLLTALRSTETGQ
ncbi:uroporphyrinogen-III synthase, partial [Vibrio xuii]